MNRLNLDVFAARESALQVSGVCHDDPVAGLLITCAADCFPPEVLAHELLPGAWFVHRSPGSIVPPFGTGHYVEEELLERAIDEWRIATLVVCGHHPCGVAEHLLTPNAPADDFVLRAWLSHAEAARRCVQDLAGPGRLRAAAEHNVQAQLANVRTHPAVAAALARGTLNLLGWLYADELLCPGPVPTSFDRRVALQPEQNRHLVRARVRTSRPPSFLCTNPPYLA